MENRNYGRGGGRGGGGRGDRGGDGHHQQDFHQGGGGGRGGRVDQYQQDHRLGGGGGRGGGGRDFTNKPPPAQHWGSRQGEARRGSSDQVAAPSRYNSGEGSARGGHGGGGACGGGGGVSHQSQRTPQQPRIDPVVIPDIQPLKVTEQLPSTSLMASTGNRLCAKRPDQGGKNATWTIDLLANHFPVKFNSQTTIFHYDVQIKPEREFFPKGRSEKMLKSTLRMIKDKLFFDDPIRFPTSKIAYDGDKNIFSAIELPTGKFKVEFSDRDDGRMSPYIVTINSVNELELCKLRDYFSGDLVSIPRDILQGMDVVMKENPTRHNILVGRGFYPRGCDAGYNLGDGNVALRGFQLSLKLTSQGPALCLDYSVLPFRKPLPVLDYLKEHIREFDVHRCSSWGEVEEASKGLKVTVTHRHTKQRFTVAKLSERITRDISFDIEDREGKVPPERTSLIKYFKDKYAKEIKYTGIPSLDLGKNGRNNYVPMEFSELVEGQTCPKEYLDKNAAWGLRNTSLALPTERKKRIDGMISAEYGPCSGDVLQNFEIEVVRNMTSVKGRVIGPPDLKVGAPNGNVKKIRVDDKCQWNLVGNSVVVGKLVDKWALIDFTSGDRFRINVDQFIQSLTNRCQKLGIRMNNPVVRRSTRMSAFSNINNVRKLLRGVVNDAKVPLQIIVCILTEKGDGYKFLKYVSEREVGVLTQCVLSKNANKESNDPSFANLGLKINPKLGGSNVELVKRVPCFEGSGHVMFVGADVNHPGSMNTTCPSVAAVVATVNWPAATRYAARICPQNHRMEKILKFGAMCLDLVHTYERLNNVKPDDIVIFRDGVSEGQFDMVLNEELTDLFEAFAQEKYRPRISLVVAQKRHQTRLFPRNNHDVCPKGNVPPGTVVDTTIVHSSGFFDFYLFSHFGGMGTSKPAHYYVLWNEHRFTSDQIQKLIFDMCFTLARSNKPVSLVPPVYYADHVAYRGRMYQEVVMKHLPPAELARSTCSNASFDEDFYKVHPELENVMFFV